MRKVVAVALVAAALSGCAGPAKREYVLGAAGASENASAVQTALPVVQVERVQLPDYLDTRDILTRRDHQIVPSETGRWAERLSVGATRALAASLGAHLKGVVVTSAQPVDPPALRVVIDVTTFGSTADGQVVLAARWTVTDGTGQRSLAAEQASFTEPVSGAPDGAVVAAMSLALEKLANRISAGIEPNLGQRRSLRAGVRPPTCRQGSSSRDQKEGDLRCVDRLWLLLRQRALALGALVVHAQQRASAPASSKGVNVGSLTCKVAGGAGFVFGSSKALSCIFTRTDGSGERYVGDVRRFGIDIGYTDRSRRSSGWFLRPATSPPAPLPAATPVPTVQGTVVVGVAANVLVGGNNGQVTLQPVSVEGSTASTSPAAWPRSS